MASGDLGSDIPALRRAQAQALGSPVGLNLAHFLIREKVLRQVGQLRDLIPETREEVRQIEIALEKLANTRTPDEVRTVEAAAALTTGRHG
jgi:CRISPR/Cas system-associated endonuclease Cas1